MSEITFRKYSPGDQPAVERLHEWAMKDAGTDPADVPGTDDVTQIEESYFDVGGKFLVGVHPDSYEELPPSRDGTVVAIGGYMPSEAGHEDERTVPGAVELHRMRVAPPAQGNGYGRQLLAELESRAFDAGYTQLLATTAHRQRRALKLYPQAGYREVARSEMGEYELVHFEKELDRS